MKQASLLIMSIVLVLIFPQYAFSDSNSTNSTTISPQTNSSSTIQIQNNNSTVTVNNTSTQNTNTNQTNQINQPTPTLDSTSVTISQGTTINQGSQMQLIAKVTDITNSSSVSTGTISWGDGTSGGTFSASTCSLTSGSCSVTYNIPANHNVIVTITSSYQGDSKHFASTGTLTPILPHGVLVSVTPNPATIIPGAQDTFTVELNDITDSKIIPTGIVSWSDGSVGGTFSAASCVSVSGTCSVSYLPPTGYKSNITISASYQEDGSHYPSSTTFVLQLDMMEKTSTIISQSSFTTNRGTQVQFSSKVSDISNPLAVPTGILTWSDGAAQGTFNPASCALSSGTCNTAYTPGVNSPDTITIAATYSGDDTHHNSTSIATLKVNMLHPTKTTLSSNSDTTTQGGQVKITVTTADLASTPTNPTGTVHFSDGSSGGTFSPTLCTISSGMCTVTYTAPQSAPSQISINATFNGDNFHSPSSSGLQLSIVVLPSSISITTDQSYYAHGDIVTLSTNLPGQSLQNIAVGVSNPTGDNIISRTITTDENGTGSIQFKIPDTYQTGTYQAMISALVYGKNYTNSTEFTVIKSHGISIDAVQIINQQGKSASMLSRGQNGFVKVSLSSDEKMPVLLTLNLFDANQSSLGTASLKSTVNPGTTQVSLSFFIPADTQVGLANVFTDAYSDWPSDGGTPIAAESCLAADLQDPSALPASYTPVTPYSCTSTSNPSTGSQFSVLTNTQAKLTLGVEIQNDTMTFMSPTQAHLLALAYENGTSKSNSVGTVNLDVSSLSSSNATKINPDQFTTLAGPDIQNNPLAMKILQEIEQSKRQVANILGNETAQKLNDQLILKQRQAAAGQLKTDLTVLAQATANTTAGAAYAHFLNTVDDKTKPVFQSEYDFMSQRVNTANTAMEDVLNNGGSLGQAIATFNKYATINHVQMVSLNKQLNIAYGLADSRVQSCFDDNGRLTVINGVNPCISYIENNSTGPNGISIISVQATDHQGNPVSLLQRGQTGYVKVVLNSAVSTQSLVTINLFDSDVSSLGTASAQYTLSPGQSEVVLPYYVPAKSATGLASVYANVFTDWPNNGGVSQTNELSYFVGLS